MKKRRFYDNKGRGKKWTEKPVGRKISFADKYVPESLDAPRDENDKKPKKKKRKSITKQQWESLLRGTIVVVCSFFIISIGYTIMDIHLERSAMPLYQTDDSSNANMNNVIINAKGTSCQPLSLDASIMLDAVIENTFDDGYSALAFDIKRSDGTIGYESQLATISSFGAISSPSSNLKGSVEAMKNNDILPIGIVSCYKDNIVPYADLTSAVLVGGSVYTDSGSNAYLNPNVDSTYNYIKSIIDEAMGMGVNMFILDNYNLPVDITDSYNDGFDAIAQRLYDDFGDELKLFKAVDLYVPVSEDTDIDEVWAKRSNGVDTTDSNTMLLISTNEPEMLKQFLDSQGINNYIIMK